MSAAEIIRSLIERSTAVTIAPGQILVLTVPEETTVEEMQTLGRICYEALDEMDCRVLIFRKDKVDAATLGVRGYVRTKSRASVTVHLDTQMHGFEPGDRVRIHREAHNA